MLICIFFLYNLLALYHIKDVAELMRECKIQVHLYLKAIKILRCLYYYLLNN